MSALLELDMLNVRYDKVRALQDVSLHLDEGEIVALIGANGAGKSTTLRAITGLVRALSGSITWQGERIDRLRPDQIVARGISMVPEGRHVYPFMSIKDNLLMGAFLRRDREGIASDLEKLFVRFPRLKERYSQQAGTLSGGEQQMVAIGRALMARPKLLLLDEPSLGLAPQVIREIARVIRSVNQDDKVNILLVEQNSRMALKVSNRGYALATGEVALKGRSSELLDNEQIRKLYLGIDDTEAAVSPEPSGTSARGDSQ